MMRGGVGSVPRSSFCLPEECAGIGCFYMPDILLVEDKESLRRVLRVTLENAGYTVTEAADARLALSEIARAPHQLVLTDLRMPNGSGIDVLREIGRASCRER